MIERVLTVPAFVWRGGFLSRAVLTGVAAGVTLGALAWLDSGLWLSGVCVLVIAGIATGIATARRMARFWPDAENLDGTDRVAVVRAARRGEGVDEKGYDRATGACRVESDARYFRPTEVDLLVGDPGKAHRKLGWRHETGVRELVREMVMADLEMARTETAARGH